MRISKKAFLTAIGLAAAVAVVAIGSVMMGVVRFWPAARTLAQDVISGREISVSSGLQRLASRVESEPLRQLLLLGVNPTTLAAIAVKPELATLLNTVAAVPEIGGLIRDGTYQEVLRRGYSPECAKYLADSAGSSGFT